LLLELKVKDVGIIDEMNWSLSDGLNVITGETGAGKSLVIDAVEALLGGKTDEEMVRHGADDALIEGVFTLQGEQKNTHLRQLLAEKGIEVNEDNLVIHCTVRRQGRSIVRVNGSAVPKAFLQQTGELLVDVHGQSDHLSLLDKRSHLNFIDSYSHTIELRTAFSGKVTELRRIEQQLKELSRNESELARREEFLRFQIDEISGAELKIGEDEELDKERRILASAEKLQGFSYEVYRSLYGEEASDSIPSSIDRLNEAIQAMKKLVEFDETLAPRLDTLQEALYNLEETAQDMHAYGDRLEYDPHRLEEIEIRVELLRSLKRKYGQTIDDILIFQEEAERELEGITHSSERKIELEASASALKEEMGTMASELSQTRSEGAEKLATEVKRELQEIGMPQVDFKVGIEHSLSEDGIPLPDGNSYAFSSDGVDSVEFIASTNPGEPHKALAKIASTGETSRFMLALKGALSEADNIPVLVFDEIDVGVGGRSGEIIGKKLWTLSRNHQIICITHLPQIAAFADAHYRVCKEVTGDRTISKLETLEKEGRTEELAAMIGGSDYSDTSLKSARELVDKARQWKGN